MQNVLLIGAGKSSSFLIRYLLDHAEKENWMITVADVSQNNALEKTKGHLRSTAIEFDINDEVSRSRIISKTDLVISMLPAIMHYPVALSCLEYKKTLLTASYVSPEIDAMHKDVVNAGVIFLNECGLDPGIDHMSAMKIIHEIKNAGGEFKSFRSYTGGLVAPESNDNPWGYKFSWNPRNVILAGQGTAKFIENNKYKYIPYCRLFKNASSIEVENVVYDGYANRDSLAYRKVYGLENIPTMIRGTLRQSDFCSAWDVFVQLGLTDDSYLIEDSEHLTYSELIRAFLPSTIKSESIREACAQFMGLKSEAKELEMVEWTGILSNQKIGIPKATPAQILQQLLETKWKLNKSDLDLIVMQHRFEYTLKGKNIVHLSSLVVKGEDAVYTAMAKTVGLPIAIAARMILTGKVKLTGVQIPVTPELYIPILHELEEYGISFKEEVR